MHEYDPFHWYWQADDGRVFASARQAIVTAKDKAFKAWVDAGHKPTRWPADDAGKQTDAALQDVLTPYGLFCDLRAYTADRRWRAETGGIVVEGVAVATDDRSKMMLMGARAQAAAVPFFTTRWKTADGFVDLDAAAIVAISDAVLAHVDACFAVEATVIEEIDAGRVTSIAEIDVADWPSSVTGPASSA